MSFISIYKELRKEHEPSYIIRRLYEEAHSKGKNCIIESVRVVGEVEFLRSKEDFFLLSVDAPLKVRYERIVRRNSESDHVSFDKFVSDNEREMNSVDPTKGNIRECMRRADFHFVNDGKLIELHKQIDEVLKKLNIFDTKPK